MTAKNWFFRLFFYVMSLLILALGITLNTKTGLGVSPIISVSYNISELFQLNFGNVTFVYYVLFVFAQLIIRGKNRRWHDLLQIVVSMVFTRFLNLYNDYLPIHFEKLWQNVLLLILAVVLTGIGAALSVNMELVPNPGDGIVAALADFFHKDMGFMKNVFDISNVCFSLILGFVFGRYFLGIGIGTVITMLGVGRVIAVFNHFCKKKMAQLSGLEA
ncbi:MAG: DUF6198 family protein [Eubacterium sp.]|nr:DUF6198 family protein [Eubacterium sp.]